MKETNKIYSIVCPDLTSPIVFDKKGAYGKYSYKLNLTESNEFCMYISGRLSFRLKLEYELYITELIEEGAIVLSTYPLTSMSIKATRMVDNANSKFPHKSKSAYFSIDSLKSDFTSKLSKLYFDVAFTDDSKGNMVLLTFSRPILDNVTSPPSPTTEELIMKEPAIIKAPRRKISMIKKRG